MKKLLLLFTLSTLLFAACNSEVSSDEEDTILVPAEDEVVDEVEEEAAVQLASSFNEFSQESYDSAIADGKDVFLDFHADWCATCVSNAPIITSAFEGVDDENIVGFKVDYDNSAELQKVFGVTSQATFILVHDGDTSDYTTTSGLLNSEQDVLDFLET